MARLQDKVALISGGSGSIGEERLREATDAALAAGVQGAPTVLVDGEPFWGDDRLDAAAARLAA